MHRQIYNTEKSHIISRFIDNQFVEKAKFTSDIIHVLSIKHTGIKFFNHKNYRDYAFCTEQINIIHILLRFIEHKNDQIIHNISDSSIDFIIKYIIFIAQINATILVLYTKNISLLNLRNLLLLFYIKSFAIISFTRLYKIYFYKNYLKNFHICTNNQTIKQLETNLLYLQNKSLMFYVFGATDVASIIKSSICFASNIISSYNQIFRAAITILKIITKHNLLLVIKNFFLTKNDFAINIANIFLSL